MIITSDYVEDRFGFLKLYFSPKANLNRMMGKRISKFIDIAEKKYADYGIVVHIEKLHLTFLTKDGKLSDTPPKGRIIQDSYYPTTIEGATKEQANDVRALFNKIVNV